MQAGLVFPDEYRARQYRSHGIFQRGKMAHNPRKRGPQFRAFASTDARQCVEQSITQALHPVDESQTESAETDEFT